MTAPVALLTLWFDHLPDWWLDFWERMQANKTVRWIFVEAKMEDVLARAERVAGVPCLKATPYSTCDLRPDRFEEIDPHLIVIWQGGLFPLPCRVRLRLRRASALALRTGDRPHKGAHRVGLGHLASAGPFPNPRRVLIECVRVCDNPRVCRVTLLQRLDDILLRWVLSDHVPFQHGHVEVFE